MTNVGIAQPRLQNQGLASARFEKAEEVVRWFGAVQAQDYQGALWGVGLRMRNVVAADVEQAMADGRIVRTHPMRGTWHFVSGEDIRWMLSLTAAGRIARSAYYNRQLELDEAVFARSNLVFAKTLEGGKQLSRRELAAALEREGISTQGLRLTFLLGRAEIDGVICSGARHGKQFTFALLDELVPVSRVPGRDEALAELARRYFTSHGPATIQDFVWWSGLTAAEARAGLALARASLVEEMIDGRSYWLAPSPDNAKMMEPSVYLLPQYDEYTVAYKDRSAIIAPAYARQIGSRGLLGPVIVVNGRVVGTWARTVKKDSIVITASISTPLNEAEMRALTAEADRYGAFFERSVDVAFM